MLKGNKGITLVALVVTIIVLLILAGVTISLVLGQNGILGQAQRSQEESDKAYAKDVVDTALKGLEVDKRVNGTNYTEADLKSQLPGGATSTTFNVTSTTAAEYTPKADIKYNITIDAANFIVTDVTK